MLVFLLEGEDDGSRRDGKGELIILSNLKPTLPKQNSVLHRLVFNSLNSHMVHHQSFFTSRKSPLRHSSLKLNATSQAMYSAACSRDGL